MDIKRIFLIAVFALAAQSAAQSALADTYVNGYYRGNGTYVQPLSTLPDYVE